MAARSTAASPGRGSGPEDPRGAARDGARYRPGSFADWWHRRTREDGPRPGERATLSYYLLLLSALALLTFGLAIVFSVQSVTIAATGGKAFASFAKNLVFAVVGLIGMILVSRMSRTALQRVAIPVFLASLVLQALVFVPGVGVDIMGNKNWIRLPGGLTAQPSEFIKLALCLVIGIGVTRHWDVLRPGVKTLPQARTFALAVLLPAGLGAGLVMAGGDLGTVIVMAVLVAGALWVSGLARRWFIALGILGLGGFAFVSALSANRRARILTWWNPDLRSPLGLDYQPRHARYALGTGGLFGVGPGSSRQKWGYLTQADSDYVFAVLGEEFGLVGSVLVIGLFAVVGWCCLRIMRRSNDLFTSVVTAGAMSWIVGQALINMSVVVGILPVLGVPLPLISAGGSSLVAVLLAFGVLLSFARQEPGAEEALRARPGAVRRTLAVVASRRRNRA